MCSITYAKFNSLGSLLMFFDFTDFYKDKKNVFS
jgi:hypothetical protein